MNPTIVSVSGFSSEVGKTTTICRLLALLPGWEAIKITRGHYRSCGKDPDTCCVSTILGEHPHVLSDPNLTRVPGKDTGRYWEAGATMVHWVIGTDDQIESGINTALSRVRAEGVLVEGASFLKYVSANYSMMVAGLATSDIKSSAVRIMSQMNALLVMRDAPGAAIESELRGRLQRRGLPTLDLPVFFERDLPLIADQIMRVHRARRIRAS